MKQVLNHSRGYGCFGLVLFAKMPSCGCVITVGSVHKMHMIRGLYRGHDVRRKRLVLKMHIEANDSGAVASFNNERNSPTTAAEQSTVIIMPPSNLRKSVC